jgi:hypothetical protein
MMQEDTGSVVDEANLFGTTQRRGDSAWAKGCDLRFLRREHDDLSPVEYEV